MKVFIDTNIPMYASSKEHPLKAGCLEIMQSVALGNLKAYTDTEVFQEILYHYFNINKHGLGLRVFDAFYQIMDGFVLSVRPQDVLRARDLTARHSDLSPQDLIHLAIMLNNNISHIITADQAFKQVDDIQAIYPT